MQDPARTIQLELRLDGDSPAGSAQVSGGQSRQFVGWLGLVAAIEALLSGDRVLGATTTPDPSTNVAASDDG